MLKFALFGIPVAVDGWFWLVVILLGHGATARGPEDWARVAVWTVVVFVSIMVHELGHAFAGRRFGATPFIRLHSFGGATFLPGAHFTRGQNILVSAAGPVCGLLLGVVVLIVAAVFRDLPTLAQVAIVDGLYVNFFWTFLNLLPIHPLDGGQILGQALGPRAARATHWIGFAVAAALCLLALSYGMLFLALMLAMLAYYNFRAERVEGGVVTEPLRPEQPRDFQSR